MAAQRWEGRFLGGLSVDVVVLGQWTAGDEAAPSPRDMNRGWVSPPPKGRAGTWKAGGPHGLHHEKTLGVISVLRTAVLQVVLLLCFA